MRGIYVGALFGLVITAWLILLGSQNVRSLGDLARFGSAVFALLAPLQLAMAVAFAALLTTAAVAQEKDRKTLDLLLLTRMTNSELVLGKLLASSLSVFVLIAAAVTEVIGKGQEMVLVAVAGKKTASECLEAYIDSLFQWLVKFPEHASVMGMLHYYGTVGAEFKELNAKVREVGEARIADMLHFGKSGTPSQRERELAKLIRELLIGNLTNVISSTDSSQLLTDCQKLKKAVFGLVDTYEKSGKR